ncbi:hypothetical protein TNCV_365201 [Trichonephila clavipes]|nr:hypothetical protein TNCV_365201 [Trichonephila clavipes]
MVIIESLRTDTGKFSVETVDVVVVVSRTEHAVDEEDAAEIDKLLEVVGAVSITELGGGDFEGDATVTEDVEERRRRIPFDFQRTSLVGLALDSATSSGLERAPALQCRDPIQAPPGTTRQAGLYTS